MGEGSKGEGAERKHLMRGKGDEVHREARPCRSRPVVKHSLSYSQEKMCVEKKSSHVCFPKLEPEQHNRTQNIGKMLES